jgi:hypothetical protein
MQSLSNRRNKRSKRNNSKSRELSAAVAALLLCSCAGRARTGAREEAPDTVEVSGTAETEVIPDQARVNLAVEVTSPTADVAAQEGGQRVQGLVDALLKSGIERQEVETLSYNVFPIYSQERRGAVEPPRIIGFRARHDLRVRLRSLDRIASILDLAANSGATQVGPVEFIVSRPQEIRAKLLGEAVENANAAASAIATSMGRGLGRALSATSFAEPPPPILFRAAAAETQEATPIFPGPQTVAATVTVKYELTAPR